MEKWMLAVISCLLIAGCFGKEQLSETDDSRTKIDETINQSKPFFTDSFTYIEQKNQKYVSVDEITKALKLNYEFDKINKSLKIIVGSSIYSLIYGVPVFETNAHYFPIDRTVLTIVEDRPYLSVDFLNEALGANTKESGNEITISFNDDPMKEVPASTVPEKPTTVDDITSILSVLNNPIKGASVSKIPNHLPGAVRAYRHGTHEGMDFYQYTSNVEINRNTPIYGMAEGKVVRADHDYVPYSSEEERNKDLASAANFTGTPQFMLDKLRGKQVWISYPNGILARFCHLDRIPQSLTVGDTVTEETIIGYVGNSGTSGEVKQDDSELHLHLDLLIYNELFWVGLNQEEVQQVLSNVFEE